MAKAKHRKDPGKRTERRAEAASPVAGGPVGSGPVGSSPSGDGAAGPSRWRSRAPALLIRLAAAWLLVGGVAKALTGTPSELPVPILEWDFDPFVVIPAAILLEVLIGVAALARPKLGWIPVAATLALFSVILVLHIRAGGESCGCFGGAFPIPAPVMLAIDASLAIVAISAGIALARPSRGTASGGGAANAPASPPAPTRRQGHPLAGPVVGLALGLALAWYADARLRPLRPVVGGGSAGLASATASQAARRLEESLGGTRTPVTVPVLPIGEPAAAARPWSLPPNFPAQIPSEVILRPITWINKPLAATELGRWTDTSQFPPDALLILYYDSCSHCAEHLRDLAERQQADPKALPPIVLVQLPTPVGPGIRRFVDRVPEGMHVHLPKEITRWVMTPPWDVWTEGRIVRRAERVRSDR